ncbi:hypothetical protein ACIP6X_32740 [Streptomyces coeruleorubidus]|uniref:hypothetical protein n=1 Tax=Streptomyces coeruleorubidus TaxID=116188 RepID=UPI0038255B41
MRVDRLEPRMPTGRTFNRRDVRHGDAVAFVDVTDIEPAELRQALRSLRTRIDEGPRGAT